MHDLTFLKIQRLIIHELPREGQPDGVMSDAVCPLQDRVRRFFEERMRESLSSKGHSGVFVKGHISPVPKLVTDLLAKRFTAKKFVGGSREIARHLFSIHKTGAHSEGLLCVVRCNSQNADAVGIIKLELEEGVRAQLKGSHGMQHFEIEVLNDLMLTQRTRVFKVALFESFEDGKTDALLSDSQARGQQIAKYFLDNFLGCELAAKPDVSTKAFFDVAERFFNQSVTDPVLRSSYQTALLAELCSNATTVRIQEFADGHLQPRDRTPFAQSLQGAGVPPSFPKDTTQVKNRIHRVQYDFEGNVSVTMPPEALNKSVMVTRVADDKTRLELELRLKDVKGTR